MMRGDIVWTWVSIAPGVAISPSPLTTTVLLPTTTSTLSRVSGFPARPIALIRRSRMPIETFRMPRTGSRMSTFEINEVTRLGESSQL